MKYQPQGKRSMSWWLQTVKWFGQDSTKGIMRGGEVPTHQVRQALDDLIGRKYVDASGPRGKGWKPKYHLTETGNRYLADNQDELNLTSPPPDRQPGAADHLTHGVPDMPGDEPLTRLPSLQDTRPTRPATTTIIPATDMAPKAVKPEPPIAPKPAANGNFKEEFRKALTDILIEKYGDQITAKEVMERL